jgi:hypothetical protein
LGSQTTYSAETDRAIVNGHHTDIVLQQLMHKYIQLFVLCPNCNLPETEYKIKTGVIYHKCAACGAKEMVDMTHKLCTFILAQDKKARSDAKKEGKKKDKKKDEKKEKKKDGSSDGSVDEKKKVRCLYNDLVLTDTLFAVPIILIEPQHIYWTLFLFGRRRRRTRNQRTRRRRKRTRTRTKRRCVEVVCFATVRSPALCESHQKFPCSFLSGEEVQGG